MPTVSPAQHRLMEAAAHTPGGYGGVPQSVGKEFVGKDAKVRAAGVAYISGDGEILLLKRSDKGDHPGEWCLPGGVVEEGETEDHAARRESVEETGMLPHWSLAPIDRRTSSEGVDFSTFAQRVEKFEPRLNDEHTAFGWHKLDALPDPIHPGLRALLAADDAKLSKTEVDYSAGKGDDRCKNCKHFIAGGSCELVEGEIDPDYWCKKFEAKAGAGAQDMAHDMALDRKSVRRYDGDQRLHVEKTHISKANVCEYLGSEIPNYQELGLQPDRRYRLYRDPDELAKGAATFNNLPLLSRHVPVDARDHHPELVIGSLGTDAEFADGYLDNSLVVWAAEPISDIENDIKKELSSAYRYRADMTPGKSPQGEAYDGVMRDIVGNHVALVKEGRAGPDVVVGDSMENLMPKNTAVKMTRRAASVLGVLSLHMQPKLAQDAKLDLRPIVAKLTSKNFKDSKPAIIVALRDATKGKLATDASIDDVAKMLDVLEQVDVAKGDDEIEVMPEETMDAEGGGLKEFLKGKLGEDDYNAACKMMGAAADAETDEDKKKREEEAAKKAAEDAEKIVDEKTKDMVTKGAMDQAIKAAVDAAEKKAVANQREIRDAENFVRPWVGTLAMAHDSAIDVYRTALTSIGVEDADKINDVTAMRAVLKAQPLPGAASKKPAPAMDAAAEKSFAERFPHAARIQVSV